MDKLNYFTFLNSDIISVIISYLSFEDLNTFIIDYADLINWKSAFIYKYFNKVRNNIDEFNIKNLYMGFTEVGATVRVIKNNIDYNRYIIYNDIVDTDDSDVALSDDIIVYEYLKYVLNDDTIIGYALTYNSLKLLEHILNKYKNINDVVESITSSYQTDEIFIEATKLVLKHYPDAKEDILLKTYFTDENKDVFKYLIDNYIFDKDVLVNVLWSENRSVYAFDNIKLIIEKYYELIKDKLPELYTSIIDNEIIIGFGYRREVITYLANLDVIRDVFLA